MIFFCFKDHYSKLLHNNSEEEKNQQYLTRGPCRLHKAAATRNIFSEISFSVKGITLRNNLKHFTLLIARSTCIRNLAIFLVFLISFMLRNFFFPQEHFLVKGGIARSAPRRKQRSRMLNPRSAITKSSSSIKSIMPQF